MKLNQHRIATELGVSDMSISRWLRSLGREGRMTELDALAMLIAAELRDRHNFSTGSALELVAEFERESKYMAARSKPCWLVTFSTHGAEVKIACITEHHLIAVLSAFELATVIDLTALAERAKERLERLKTELANERAAA